jgi:hypothetical protein
LATITLAVLNMAGATVADDSLVERAFTEAVAAVGVSEQDGRFPAMLDHVRRTMGQSKSVVFRALLPEDQARQANSAFEPAYGRLVAAGRCEPVPGAAQTIRDPARRRRPHRRRRRRGVRRRRRHPRAGLRPRSARAAPTSAGTRRPITARQSSRR